MQRDADSIANRLRVGQILATLKAEGIDQNTIVVFMSDNGPEANEQATADPYRGVKWDALEGGNRVPCIISWPGVIPPGQTSNALIASIDLLPPLCQACGIDLSSKTTGSPAIDGVSVWDTLLGKQCLGTFERHSFFVHESLDGPKRIQVLRTEHAATIGALDRTDILGEFGFPISDHMCLEPKFACSLANRTECLS